MNRREYNSTATRKHIERTLLTMLEEGKHLHKISTSELCKQCGIAKSTFYIYFPDKYAVLEQIVAEVTSELYQINDSFKNYSISDLISGKPTPIAQEMVAYLSKNKALFRVLMGPNGVPDFMYQNKAVIESKFTELYRALHMPPKHEKLVASHFFSGVIGLFRFYLFENTSYTDEQMVIVFGNMLKSVLSIADHI